MKKIFAAMVLMALMAMVCGAVVSTANVQRSWQVPDYYLVNGMDKTGSANIVNSIVWDFRGYDTLGEEVVLFTATLGIIALLRGRKDG